MDLLGFREIVNKTTESDAFLTNIYEVLSSITADPIAAETFTMFDRNLMLNKRPEGIEYSETHESIFNSMKEMTDWINVQALERKSMSSLAVTHFSDSLVLSADIKDEPSVIGLLELAAKVSYRLWQDYSILTRGGITVGPLIHQESGVLIGPAMVRAYELESTLAVHPRILMDENCAIFVNKLASYTKLKYLFKPILEPIINEKKGTRLNGGLEINLATSYSHFQNGPFGGSPLVIKRYDRSLKAALPRLREIRATISDPYIIKKYDYIITELEEYSKDYPFWDEL